MKKNKQYFDTNQTIEPEILMDRPRTRLRSIPQSEYLTFILPSADANCLDIRLSRNTIDPAQL